MFDITISYSGLIDMQMLPDVTQQQANSSDITAAHECEEFRLWMVR